MDIGQSKYNNKKKLLEKKKDSLSKKKLNIASEEYYEKVDTFSSEICRRLSEARLQAGVTTAELSRATGLTEAAIYKYEKTGRISMPTFAKVIFALQLEIDVIPLFHSKVTLGNEFEYIVQGLDARIQTKILEEIRSIVSLIKKCN